MTKKPLRKVSIGLGIIASLVLLTIAFSTIPIASYVSRGCPSGEPPVERLSVLGGDSLTKIKAADTNGNNNRVNQGCSVSINYKLYLI